MTCPECQPDQETTNTQPVVGYYVPQRAENVPLRAEPKDKGLFVPRKEYFDHENWGNS